MWAEHLFFGLRSDLRRRAETTACRLLRGMKIPLLRLSGGSRSCSANLPIGSLSDTNEEVALIRRFARNYDISFRVFSKRYRPTSGAHEAWAAKFLERVDTARAAVAARSEDNNS